MLLALHSLKTKEKYTHTNNWVGSIARLLCYESHSINHIKSCSSVVWFHRECVIKEPYFGIIYHGR